MSGRYGLPRLVYCVLYHILVISMIMSSVEIVSVSAPSTIGLTDPEMVVALSVGHEMSEMSSSEPSVSKGKKRSLSAGFLDECYGNESEVAAAKKKPRGRPVKSATDASQKPRSTAKEGGKMAVRLNKSMSKVTLLDAMTQTEVSIVHNAEVPSDVWSSVVSNASLTELILKKIKEA